MRGQIEPVSKKTPGCFSGPLPAVRAAAWGARENCLGPHVYATEAKQSLLPDKGQLAVTCAPSSMVKAATEGT